MEMLKSLENNISFNVAPNARVTINETIGQLDLAEIRLQSLSLGIRNFAGVRPDPALALRYPKIDSRARLPRYLKAVMGHARMKSTHIYLHPSMRLLRKAVNDHLASDILNELFDRNCIVLRVHQKREVRTAA